MTAYFSALSNLHFISFPAFHIDPTTLLRKQVSAEASQCCQVDSSNSLQLLAKSDLTMDFSAGFYTMLIHPVTFEGQNKCWQWDDVRWGWCYFPCVSAEWFTFQSPLQATPTAQTKQNRVEWSWAEPVKWKLTTHHSRQHVCWAKCMCLCLYASCLSVWTGTSYANVGQAFYNCS